MAEKKTIVDRVFGIPKGAEDEFSFKDESETNFNLVQGAAQSEEELENLLYELTVGDEDDEPVELGRVVSEPSSKDKSGGQGGLSTPVDFYIVSQKVRRTPSGMQVVDVLFEIEDIPGAATYEFQVTKR